MSAPTGHGLDLDRPRWDPSSGMLALFCVCGFEVEGFPPNPYTYCSDLSIFEAQQITAFRRHLETVRGG